MIKAEQGDILKVHGLPDPAMVVSNNLFNTSGLVVTCPIIKTAEEGPLHVRLKNEPVEGYVLCEQLRLIDLSARRFSKLASTHYFNVIDISDAIMGIFDYQAL